MEKLKRWLAEHETEIIGFGVFLAFFVVIIVGVLYYSFIDPPQEAKAETTLEYSVDVKGQKEKDDNEEKEKKNNAKESETQTDKNNEVEERRQEEQEETLEKKQEVAARQEEQNKDQDKKEDSGEKTDTTVASVATREATPADQEVNTGSSSSAAFSNQGSSNAQTTQEQTPVQETPSQEAPEETQPTTPEPEPEPQPVWHEPVYEQQWVVDQAAWDETVSEPIYETVELCICNGCGADITNNIDGHLESQMMAGNMACSGYHSEWQEIQTGTNTYTVHHDEVGHWENVLVQEGYWE